MSQSERGCSERSHLLRAVHSPRKPHNILWAVFVKDFARVYRSTWRLSEQFNSLRVRLVCSGQAWLYGKRLCPEQFFKTCSGLTQLARISPTKLSTYYRDLSSSVSIAFCCSSNALRSPALSAISFFSRPMAIVTFIHWRRSYLLSALSICLCGINIIGAPLPLSLLNPVLSGLGSSAYFIGDTFLSLLL